MEKRVVIFLSFCSMAVMCLCITVLLKYPGLHLASLALQERTAEGNGLSVLSLLKDNSQLLQMSEDYAELQEHQLRLELPGSVKKEDITITNNYMSHEISLAIPGIGKTYFYDFPMVGNSDNIEDLRYDVDDRVGIINITTSRIYDKKEELSLSGFQEAPPGISICRGNRRGARGQGSGGEPG